MENLTTDKTTLDDHIDLGETPGAFITFSLKGTKRYKAENTSTMDYLSGNASHKDFLRQIEAAYGSSLPAVTVISIVELIEDDKNVVPIHRLKCLNKDCQESNGIVITVPHPFGGLGGNVTFLHKPKRTSGKVSNSMG